ncbi:MAG: hypothetical protein Q8P34_14900 [Bacteroidota bacterium]|nr:hypothetical protein [Bacteroidota bacterium]
MLITIFPEIATAQLHDDISIENNTSADFNVAIAGGTSPFTVNYAINGVAQTPIANYLAEANISTGILSSGIYTYALTSVTDANGCAAQSLGTPITVTVTTTLHYDFTYPDRNSLFADGWNFTAVTPSGGSRNTEQTSGAVVSYDQQAHPGVLRIPVDVGDLWAGYNNTRNTLFRDLPSGWTSVSLKIASFAPIKNYQQAGLAVYQDDNNYVQITRIFEGGNRITFVSEVGSNAKNLITVSESTSSNIHFRLDRDPITETITSYYSLDGINWNRMGSIGQPMNNPRLAIVVGASPDGFPDADIAWAEVTWTSIPITDELRAYPNAIVFNSVLGNQSNDIKSINIFTAFGKKISWSQSSDVSWITSNLQNGETESILKVGVNTDGLSSGIHNGNITINSSQSTADPIVIPVTLIINPDVPVKITTWKDGLEGSMSVSVDDGQPSGFDALQRNGFKGTYVSNGTIPPTFYTNYYNAGMELGSHLVNHPCRIVFDDNLRYQEIIPNISGICANTPQPCKDIISLIWPCGYTNYREQAIASEYFLSARGYNINQLEDATPDNFMNLKSFNSHEHTPYPPSDFKTIVDAAIIQHKWFNLVLHTVTNDDGAIDYAHSKNIWVAPIGTVIKYILQRDRLILTNFNENTDKIIFRVSRLAIPSSSAMNFEEAFGPNDLTTMQIDIDDNKAIENTLIDDIINPYQTRVINGNKFLLTNIRLEPNITKKVEIKYSDKPIILLSLDTNTINFNTLEGVNPTNQFLNITANVPEYFSWSATVDNNSQPAWLIVDPNTGTGNGTLPVSVNSTELAAGNYTKTITITSTEASNSPMTVTVNLTVIPKNLSHYDFTYPDRNSLLAGGWDFIAVTPSGGSRNTEQMSGAVVSYDQQTHPGVLRIPVDVGDLWAGYNNTRNTLFRDLPSGWTSVRLKISSFAPTKNTQQAGLAVYQDDNNYLYITRVFNGTNRVTFVNEIGGSPSSNTIVESSTSNLYFRFDRDPATETITSYYSLNNINWTLMGNVVRSLNNPRLAIVSGASPSGYPNLDIAWVEVIDGNSLKKSVISSTVSKDEIKQDTVVLNWKSNTKMNVEKIPL